MPNVPIKILFVDDEADIVEPLIEEAQDLGYETLFFDRGEDALAAIKDIADTLALVVCDYRMPDIDGLTFRERMFPEFQHIPFIVYSGFVTQEILRNAINLKVSKFVDKPFDIDKLKDLILAEAKDRVELIEEKAVLKSIFIDEAQELLEDLEETILLLEHDPHPERINTIFRLVHTIKGGSGVLDWPDFTKILHGYEDLLSKIKNQDIAITPSVISMLLKGYDFLDKTLNAFIDGKPVVIDVSYWIHNFNETNIEEESFQDKEKSKKNPSSVKKENELIKVPIKILDEFMELSGEITVIRNTVNKLVGNLQKELSGNQDLSLLAEFLDEMHKINSSMQHKITELRKVSLKNVFRNIPRTIRDLNHSLGKKIDLSIHGENLRVDNNLATVLKNSMIHIVRNSADHGIELPNMRKKSGKPEKGLISIDAHEQGDEVIIDLSDDGAGINSDMILQRAVEKGLYTQDESRNLSTYQINQIIMEPGFSTAMSITDISGRGVGMDMVKSSVESIGGRIDINSQLGQGTKFTFKLPIPKSVTIIHSLLVTIGHNEFSIPQDNIIRLIKIDSDRINKSIHNLEGTQLLEVNGSLVPLIDLKPELCPEFKVTMNHESLEIVILKSEKTDYSKELLLWETALSVLF